MARQKKRNRSRTRRIIIHNEARTRVYIVWDSRQRQKVVVKRFRDKIQAIRERNALRSMTDHTYIVRYHRYYVRNGRGHVVMERVQGRTLGLVTRRYGPFDQDKTIDMALAVLRGLSVIHEHGYVHGDFHSRNIIVTDIEKPEIKIIDFQHAVKKNTLGIARSYRRLAMPPVKLAPETRRRHIQDSYDIYGVGYICSMMMTGRPPRRRASIVPKRRTDAAIWGVIAKATSRNPDERYQSAQEMIEALEAIRGS